MLVQLFTDSSVYSQASIKPWHGTGINDKSTMITYSLGRRPRWGLRPRTEELIDKNTHTKLDWITFPSFTCFQDDCFFMVISSIIIHYSWGISTQWDVFMQTCVREIEFHCITAHATAQMPFLRQIFLLKSQLCFVSDFWSLICPSFLWSISSSTLVFVLCSGRTGQDRKWTAKGLVTYPVAYA